MGGGIVALILREMKAFMGGHDFILEHPDFLESLSLALGYTFS